MDGVMGTVGSSRALLVLTEQLTRHGIVIPVPDHTAASVVRALNRLERQWSRGRGLFHSGAECDKLVAYLSTAQNC
jgi:IS30 family transposase